jgi:hypothetical protein
VSDALAAALERAGVRVTKRHDDGCACTVRDGQRARRATIRTAYFEAALAAASTGRAAAAGHAFVRGVYATLAEPATAEGAELAFEEAARTVLPSLEWGAPFAAGVAAAGGEAPYLRPFAAHVAAAYVVELDDGIRVLSAAQVASWAVTADRLERAAVSILYHRSWGGSLERGTDGVWRSTVADGNDAARALMLDQWAYDVVRNGALFAVPTCDALLVADDTAAGRAALGAALRAADADTLLYSAILRWERGAVSTAD